MKFTQKLGYTVIKTNAYSGSGIERLKKLLENNTSVLAGQSGVRKVKHYK